MSLKDQILASTETETLEQYIGDHKFDVLACGHTHVQLLRRLKGKTIVGVGSVGMPFVSPYDGSGPPRIFKRSEYAIIDLSKGFSAELRQIPYDFEAYRERVTRSSMPFRDWWCEQWIDT
ncbi:MAG: hypothetical protein AAF633_21740 [Chloroflexota bacterium]